MEIFIDVVFFENLIMNFLILMLTAKFSKSKTSSLRLFLAALLGALYVVMMILLPGIKAYYTTAAKILLSMVIVAVAFTPEKFLNFFKTLAIFYISTFIFAGAAFAFLFFSNSGGFVKNGVVYASKPKWTWLPMAIITVAIIARIFWDVIQYKFTREKLLIPLKISFESKIIDLAALIDTGNALHDPLSNLPVVVVEFLAIRDILPSEIKNIFEESKENDLSSVTNIVAGSGWISRFRLIPFSSLGKENGMLIGFKPDYIEVGSDNEKKGISNVIVGIYNKALSKNEKYKALLSPELVS